MCSRAEPMSSVERVAAFEPARERCSCCFSAVYANIRSRFRAGSCRGTVSTGPAHFAFAVDKADIADVARPGSSALRIPIESRVDWPRGGHSIYFRDPDGRSVELATPGIWPSY